MLQGGTRISAKAGWFGYETRPVDRARRLVTSGVLPRQNEKRRKIENSPAVRMYQCEAGACAGNNSCNGNRTGLLCGYCAAGYALEVDQCTKCSAGDNANILQNVLTALGTLLVLLVLFLLGWREVVEGNYVHMAYDKFLEVLLHGMARLSPLLNCWSQAQDVKDQAEQLKEKAQDRLDLLKEAADDNFLEKKSLGLIQDPAVQKILAQAAKIAIGLALCRALSLFPVAGIEFTVSDKRAVLCRLLPGDEKLLQFRHRLARHLDKVSPWRCQSDHLRHF
jgi:hypothetical protein